MSRVTASGDRRVSLGIDLGTTELKVLLLDREHRVLASAHAPLSVQRPQPLWSEQDPAAWWAALEAAMAELKAGHADALARVSAIGLSGQMHGAVLLDETDAVLRPAILWNDGRSGAQCATLARRVEGFATLTGNLAMPGFTAPKLLWVAEHEPERFARTRCVLLPKDWLRLLLTGTRFSDPSDAAGTLWLDVARRDWSDALLAATGLTRAHMPQLAEGSAATGTVRPALARRWGLAEGVVVAAGGGDNAATAVGIGARAPGAGFLSLGTSGVLFVCTDRHRPNPAQGVHAFCHALPGLWHQMSVMLSAASCLRWFTRICARADEAALLAEVATLDRAGFAAAPLFLPYLAGERTPHNDPRATGVFFGLTHAHGAAALGYAVIEGVGFGLLDGLRALQAAGTEVGELSLVGGGARSPLWCQLLADTLGLVLHTHQAGETGAALGAARLGWLADGGDPDTVCTQPPVTASYRPDAHRRAALAARAERFRALYPLLGPAYAAQP